MTVPVAAPQAPTDGPSPAEIVAAARLWVGTPYHHQQAVRGHGCDCVGLIAGVWRAVYGADPGALPAYSGDWGEADGAEHVLDAARRRLREVALVHAVAGDVIVYRWRRSRAAKHAALLVDGRWDNGRIVHAYEKAGRVVETGAHAWARFAVAAFAFPPRRKVDG